MLARRLSPLRFPLLANPCFHTFNFFIFSLLSTNPVQTLCNQTLANSQRRGRGTGSASTCAQKPCLSVTPAQMATLFIAFCLFTRRLTLTLSFVTLTEGFSR